MRTATCRSCGRPILWCTSVATGRAMPVDADPTPDGNVEVTEHPDPAASMLRAVVHAQPPLGSPPLRMAHHATCPQADEWRKRR